MAAYRIDPKEIEGLEPIATGWKVVDDEYKAHGGYCYADENGKAEGSVHKVDGELKHCKNGLHFCDNPLDCAKYAQIVQWNNFLKVSAYGEVLPEQDNKRVARIVKVEKVLTFDAFINEIKTEAHSYGTAYSYGTVNSRGVSNCLYIRACKGVYNSIFAYNKSGQNYLFNKKVRAERIEEVKVKICELVGDWFPKFNNAFELYEKCGNWELVNPNKIKTNSSKEAYADMPKKLEEYLRSLPEFDEKVFNAVTGRGE